METQKPNVPRNPPANPRWWQLPVGEAHSAVVSYVHYIETEQDDIRVRNEELLYLYMNKMRGGLRQAERLVVEALTERGRAAPLTMNVCQSCVDTLASKICTHRPRPQFLTNGGNWSQRNRAKNLDRFVEGAFYETKLYDKVRDVFYDAAIFGTGFLNIYEEESRIHAKRVPPFEIFVDEQTALTDKPRSLFRKKLVSAEVLKAIYGDTREKRRRIDEAAGNGRSVVTADDYMVSQDMVEVVEGWHLKSGRDGKDGRRVMCIDGCTLIDEAYDLDDFPFVVLRWSRRPVGYYGQGIVEQLEGIQYEINKLLHRIQRAMHMYSVAITYVARGSVKKTHLMNETGIIVEYEPPGPAPETKMPNAISSEVFNHLWTLYAKAYELSGVSQLSATSRKPSGDLSGVALRTLQDVETERFALLVSDVDELIMEAARRFVGLARRIYKYDPSFSTYHRAKDFITSIKWSEVDLDEQDYVIQVYPSSQLPRTPAGRLQLVQEMIGSGMISAGEGLRLLGFPDVESAMSAEVIALEDIDRLIEKMLYNGEYEPPDEYCVTEDAIDRVKSARTRAKGDGAPDDKIRLLEVWMDDAQELLEQQAQQLAPPPAPMTAGPAPESEPVPIPQGGSGVPPEVMT